MDTDVEDDAHICLKCRTTIIGLDNYVTHRKSGCQVRKPVVDLPPSLEEEQDPNLKADDFFSSLELQSSSKKPPVSVPNILTKNFGILTRSRKSAVIKNVSKDLYQIQSQRESATEDLQIISEILRASSNDPLKKQEVEVEVEESNDEYEDLVLLEDDEHAPPRSHTGGKWKPGRQETSPPTWSRQDRTAGSWLVLDTPPPSHTGGKWKPQTPIQSVMLHPLQHSDDEEEVHGVDSAPPPGHTSGKWAPGRDVTTSGGEHRKFGNTIQYWCGPCNRRLSSRNLYDKHLKSELHARRTYQERELDNDLYPGNREVNKDIQGRNDRGDGKRIVKPTELYEESELFPGNKKISKLEENVEIKKKKKTKKRKEFVKCDVCLSTVSCAMMGKHLVSHYHRRKALRDDPLNEMLVLANIHRVVRQAPFQCSPCRFYCNTMGTFKRHWRSQLHTLNDEKTNGRYWCSICNCICDTTSDMLDHFDSDDHKDLILSTNHSVPIVIRKRHLISCWTCDQQFQYNAQLRKHCLKTLHPDFNSAEDQRFFCNHCTFRAHSRRSLQRHMTMTHRDKAEFFCSLCGVNFASSSEAASHRNGQEHKYKSLKDRKSRGLIDKDLTKTCQHCGSRFENVLELKTHLRVEHPGSAYRCPHCGKSFTLCQEVSRHVRDRACVFFETSQHSLTTPSSSSKQETTTLADREESTVANNDVTSSAFNCPQCPYKTDSKAESLVHEILHGDSKVKKSKTVSHPKYQCTMCEKLVRKTALLSHINTHLGDHTFVCETCGKAFGYRSSMISHMKRVHLGGDESEHDVSYECETSTCNFKTSSRATLLRHSLRHTVRPKPFLCAVCGSNFRLRHNLQQHMKLHTGKEYKCDLTGCIFECRSRAELRNHWTAHSDERAFKCAVCDYAAKTKPQLKRHRLIHEEVKGHACSHCPFKSRISSHLRRHLRLHTGAKPYRCPYCSYTCNILENLRKHVLTTSKHPGKKMYECKFCCTELYATNMAKDFKVHLVTVHPTTFNTASVATTYIAGIYDADDDPRHIDTPLAVRPRPERNMVTGKRDSGAKTTSLKIMPIKKNKKLSKKVEPNSLAKTIVDDCEVNRAVDSREVNRAVNVVDNPTGDVIFITSVSDVPAGSAVLFAGEADQYLSVIGYDRQHGALIGQEEIIMLPLESDVTVTVASIDHVDEQLVGEQQ